MDEHTGFLLAFLSSAASPGPETAAVLSRALDHGMVRVLPLVSGLVVGKLLMLCLALLGYSWLATVLGPWMLLLQWMGALYLLHLGIKKWLQAAKPPALPGKIKPSSVFAEGATGLALTLSNPMALLFYVALLPGVVTGTVGPGRLLLLMGMVAGVTLLVSLTWASLAGAGRRLLASSRQRQRLNRLSAGLMVLAAVLVALRSA